LFVHIKSKGRHALLKEALETVLMVKIV